MGPYTIYKWSYNPYKKMAENKWVSLGLFHNISRPTIGNSVAIGHSRGYWCSSDTSSQAWWPTVDSICCQSGITQGSLNGTHCGDQTSSKCMLDWKDLRLNIMHWFGLVSYHDACYPSRNQQLAPEYLRSQTGKDRLPTANWLIDQSQMTARPL